MGTPSLALALPSDRRLASNGLVGGTRHPWNTLGNPRRASPSRRPGHSSFQASVGLGNTLFSSIHATRSLLRLQKGTSLHPFLRLGTGFAENDPDRPFARTGRL